MHYEEIHFLDFVMSQTIEKKYFLNHCIIIVNLVTGLNG